MTHSLGGAKALPLGVAPLWGLQNPKVGLGLGIHVPWEALHGEENTVTFFQFTWTLSQSPWGPRVPLTNSQVMRRTLHSCIAGVITLILALRISFRIISI